jgi:hypothetical protein
MLCDDLAKTRQIGAHKRSAVWISSGAANHAVLDCGIEPL